MDELTPWWTVNGVWLPTQERWNSTYQALTPRIAEDMARLDAQEAWAAAGMTGKPEFWVTGVYEGRHNDVSAAYTTRVDPDYIPPLDAP